ncbi:hypothetical protein MBGDF03_00121 [Thermoplasmatales archaeon SCGC AB-540-F20]|nr:hypothetical protein MBGDF03_00121 [Thermoplasmatales archaeon SCGC AB-540-F20]
MKKLQKATPLIKNIGRTVKDIFCGMQIIEMDKARIRRRNIRGRFTGKLYTNQRWSNLLKAIERFDIDNSWKIDIPSQFDWDRQSALEVARTLIDLDIAYLF